MKQKRSILIFGVNSFLGSNLAEFFKRDFKVYGTYKSQKIEIESVLTVPCDVLDREQVKRVVYTFRPDIIIYAVGMRSVVSCSEHKEKAEALNSSGLLNVAIMVERFRSLLCCFTSQYVFSGDDKVYVESDIPDPETILGETESSTEFYVQKNVLNYLVFRCCSLYGMSLKEHVPNILEIIQRQNYMGLEVGMDDSVKGGFLDIYFLAMILKICFKKGVSNRLFQISSTDLATYYDFAKAYAEVFDYKNQVLVKKKWNFPLKGGLKPYDRILNFEFDTMNIESFLNVKMPTIKDSLEFSFNRLNGQSSKKSKVGGSGMGISYI